MMDASQQVRHLVDITTPNMPKVNCGRFSRRYNRCIPVLFAPWINDRPVLENVGIGFTSDLSDHGFSIITLEGFDTGDCGELVIGFWIPQRDMIEPWYFHTHVRSQRPIIKNFNLIGLEIAEFLNDSKRKRTKVLDDVFTRLIPESLQPVSAREEASWTG
jgi:hypothetical protein